MRTAVGVPEYESTVGGTSGLGYADFVTGQLSAFGQGRPFYDNDKSDYYGLYIQDAWRVTGWYERRWTSYGRFDVGGHRMSRASRGHVLDMGTSGLWPAAS